MMRDVCDRCLAVNTTTRKFAVLNTTLFDNDELVIDTTMSICPKCKPIIQGIVIDRVMLTETPDDVKRGSVFDKTNDMPVLTVDPLDP